MAVITASCKPVTAVSFRIYMSAIPFKKSTGNPGHHALQQHEHCLLKQDCPTTHEF